MRKQAHSQHSELWLVSYADLMTLLFGFFFLLYVTQEEGLKSISESINEVIAPKATKIEKVASDKDISKARLYLNPCRLCVSYSIRHPDMSTKHFPFPTLTVYEVVPEGPAAKAGIQDLDIIVKMDGKEATMKNSNELLEKLEPNATLNLTIYRNKQLITLPVKLDLFSDEQVAAFQKEVPEVEFETGVFGHKISESDRVKLYIPRTIDGYLVTKVKSSRSVLREGEVFVEKKESEDGLSDIYKIYSKRDILWITQRRN